VQSDGHVRDVIAACQERFRHEGDRTTGNEKQEDGGVDELAVVTKALSITRSDTVEYGGKDEFIHILLEHLQQRLCCIGQLKYRVQRLFLSSNISHNS
jgi:hypothetical protein